MGVERRRGGAGSEEEVDKKIEGWFISAERGRRKRRGSRERVEEKREESDLGWGGAGKERTRRLLHFGGLKKKVWREEDPLGWSIRERK